MEYSQFIQSSFVPRPGRFCIMTIPTMTITMTLFPIVQSSLHSHIPASVVVPTLPPAFASHSSQFNACKNHLGFRAAPRRGILQQHSFSTHSSPPSLHTSNISRIRVRHCWSALSGSNNDGFDDRSDNFSTPPVSQTFSSSRKSKQQAKKQIASIFGASSEEEFMELSLAGRCSAPLPPGSNGSIDMLFLSPLDDCEAMSDAYIRSLLSDIATDASETNSGTNPTIPALPIPLSPSLSSSSLRLLSHACSSRHRVRKDDQPTFPNKSLSKTTLLALTPLLTNRDNGLFDNIPWSTWSIDPDLRERDAANNVVESKYTMGKRVAYQRLNGKDWQGRSLSVANLANRLRYMLENNADDYDNQKTADQGNVARSIDSANDGEVRRKYEGIIMDEWDEFDTLLSDISTNNNNSGNKNGSNGSNNKDEIMISLSERLLQLEINEARMEMAHCQQRLAIAETAANSDVDSAAETTDNVDDTIETNIITAAQNLENAKRRLQTAEKSLEQLNDVMESTQGKDENNLLSFLPFNLPWGNNNYGNENNGGGKQDDKRSTQSLLNTILEQFTYQPNPPPYRGAMGYPAKLDTKREMFQDSVQPYPSPYHLLIEILQEQLNSDIVGCVLEQSSLFEGNLVLGGAILLERRGRIKSTVINGEVLEYEDDDDDYGNNNVLPRNMYVVECYVEEAIGMAMASDMGVWLQKDIWDRVGAKSSALVELDVPKSLQIQNDTKRFGPFDLSSISAINRIPIVRPLNNYLPQMEGEKIISQQEENRVRMPMTTNPELFNGAFQVPSSNSRQSSSTFSTYNPIRSLEEYDALDNDAKARILLKLESFRGVLPRPRVVQSSSNQSKTNPSINSKINSPVPNILDDMLLPLVDESVRLQYKIRDAERRGDLNEASALRESMTPNQKARLMALENARLARQGFTNSNTDDYGKNNDNNIENEWEEEARQWEDEAELYASLRADITQDEGSYSRFLDRDEWYERETRARIARLDKKKFGTLLDGMD